MQKLGVAASRSRPSVINRKRWG